MKKEIWKDIPGYKGRYQASTYGRIRSLDRYVNSKNGTLRHVKERILKQHVKDATGHFAVSLGKGTQGFCVHRAVALAFIGEPPDNCEVLHNNGNPKDNRPCNLRYGTRTENILDVYKHTGHWKKLSTEDVDAIRFALFCGIKQNEIALMFDISPSLVHDIKTGRRYSWHK